MDDLISRQDAIDAAVEAADEWDGGYSRSREEIITLKLRMLPSADRPRGEWIYCEDEYGTDGYRCSNCGRHIPWDYQHKFINFIDDYHTCPFCEARMKGADDEF